MPLFIDIETRSAIDLRKTGQYVYAQHPTTEITMVAFAALEAGPVDVWIPSRIPEIPLFLQLALADPALRLVAHNASFERILLSSPAGRRIGCPDVSDPHRWACTAARAAALGLPRTLDGAGAALGLRAQKDKEGHALMLRMCKPRKPRKDEPTDRLLWHETPEQIDRETAYCKQDVEVEREIHRILPELSATERRVWELTETMNDTGVPVDVPLLGAMLRVIEDAEIRLDADICLASEGVVPRVTDHGALTRWLVTQGIDDAANTGVGKAAVAAMLENAELAPVIRNVLALRRDGGGTSAKKYRAVLQRLSDDGAIRGVMVYCGAASTGRWSSRGAQLQNLARGGAIKGADGNAIDALYMVRDILAGASADEIEFLYGPALVVAADCLRPLFQATPGTWLARGDYSQIEARVNPWLAGAKWKLDAFRAYDAGVGPDLYKISASGIYRVPVDQVTKDQRQIGKVGELALGFQGGKAAFQAMAKGYGVKIGDTQAETIKLAWREANPEIVAFWRALNDAAIECMSRPPGDETQVLGTPITFRRSRAALTMRLPSGRRLFYWSARLRDVPTPWGVRPAVVYRSEDAVTHRWAEFVGYGGLWCENAVQATARDLMADSLVHLADAGLRPLLTVHDEAVCALSKDNFPTAAEAAHAVEQIMRATPAWAAGLPVAADASAAERYVKG